MECTVIDCDNIIDDDELQCKACEETSKKLESLWKEKTKELILDDDL